MVKPVGIEKKNNVSTRPWLLGGGLLVMMLIAYILYNVYIQDMVSLAALANAKTSLGAFVRDYAIFVFVAGILSYALVTSILLPVVVWLSLLISYSFAAAYGVWVGALIASLSIYLGVLAGLPLAFLAVRYIVGDRLRSRFGPSIDRFAKGGGAGRFVLHHGPAPYSSGPLYLGQCGACLGAGEAFNAPVSLSDRIGAWHLCLCLFGGEPDHGSRLDIHSGILANPGRVCGPWSAIVDTYFDPAFGPRIHGDTAWRWHPQNPLI